MGNSQSQNPLWYSTNSELELSEQNLTFLKTKKDTRIGDIDEFEHAPTKKKLLRKEILIEDAAQLTSGNLDKLKARVHLRHKNILQTYGFELEIVAEGPSKIRLFFEPFLSDAGAAFDAQQKSKTRFAAEELLGSLNATVQALAYLQKHNISHGNITPKSILMSQDGDIKILDHSLIEKEHSAYAACLQGAKSSYLAPELLGLLGSDTEIPSDFNAFKADLYSLGMTFLHAALLEEPSDCYVWDTYYFDFIKLMDRLDHVREKYPGRFANVLSNMLKVDIAHRPDVHALLVSLQEGQKAQSGKQAQTTSTSKKLTVGNMTAVHIEDLKTGQNFSPRAETQALPTKKYTFVDPKVQKIIRESRQRNWIKSSLSSSGKNTSREKERIPNLSPTGLRYTNPFLEGSLTYPTKNKLERIQVTQATNEEEFDPNKFVFNKPQVNKIIANILRSRSKGSTEKRLNYSPLSTRYIESHLKDNAQGGKSHRSKPSYENLGLVLNFETPEKKIYLIDELSKNYLHSGVKLQDIAATNYSYQTKVRSKEEIIRELREKYGNRQKIPEAHEKTQGKEELGVDKEELRDDQKELKNLHEIEA